MNNFMRLLLVKGLCFCLIFWFTHVLATTHDADSNDGANSAKYAIKDQKKPGSHLAGSSIPSNSSLHPVFSVGENGGDASSVARDLGAFDLKKYIDNYIGRKYKLYDNDEKAKIVSEIMSFAEDESASQEVKDLYLSLTRERDQYRRKIFKKKVKLLLVEYQNSKDKELSLASETETVSTIKATTIPKRFSKQDDAAHSSSDVQPQQVTIDLNHSDRSKQTRLKNNASTTVSLSAESDRIPAIWERSVDSDVPHHVLPARCQTTFRLQEYIKSKSSNIENKDNAFFSGLVCFATNGPADPSTKELFTKIMYKYDSYDYDQLCLKASKLLNSYRKYINFKKESTFVSEAVSTTESFNHSGSPFEQHRTRSKHSNARPQQVPTDHLESLPKSNPDHFDNDGSSTFPRAKESSRPADFLESGAVSVAPSHTLPTRHQSSFDLEQYIKDKFACYDMTSKQHTDLIIKLVECAGLDPYTKELLEDLTENPHGYSYDKLERKAVELVNIYGEYETIKEQNKVASEAVSTTESFNHSGSPSEQHRTRSQHSNARPQQVPTDHLESLPKSNPDHFDNDGSSTFSRAKESSRLADFSESGAVSVAPSHTLPTRHQSSFDLEQYIKDKFACFDMTSKQHTDLITKLVECAGLDSYTKELLEDLTENSHGYSYDKLERKADELVNIYGEYETIKEQNKAASEAVSTTGFPKRLENSPEPHSIRSSNNVQLQEVPAESLSLPQIVPVGSLLLPQEVPAESLSLQPRNLDHNYLPQQESAPSADQGMLLENYNRFSMIEFLRSAFTHDDGNMASSCLSNIMTFIRMYRDSTMLNQWNFVHSPDCNITHQQRCSVAYEMCKRYMKHTEPDDNISLFNAMQVNTYQMMFGQVQNVQCHNSNSEAQPRQRENSAYHNSGSEAQPRQRGDSACHDLSSEAQPRQRGNAACRSSRRARRITHMMNSNILPISIGHCYSKTVFVLPFSTTTRCASDSSVNMIHSQFVSMQHSDTQEKEFESTTVNDVTDVALEQINAQEVGAENNLMDSLITNNTSIDTKQQHDDTSCLFQCLSQGTTFVPMSFIKEILSKFYNHSLGRSYEDDFFKCCISMGSSKRYVMTLLWLLLKNESKECFGDIYLAFCGFDKPEKGPDYEFNKSKLELLNSIITSSKENNSPSPSSFFVLCDMIGNDREWRACVFQENDSDYRNKDVFESNKCDDYVNFEVIKYIENSLKITFFQAQCVFMLIGECFSNEEICIFVGLCNNEDWKNKACNRNVEATIRIEVIEACMMGLACYIFCNKQYQKFAYEICAMHNSYFVTDRNSTAVQPVHNSPVHEE